jgi:hypothetical protein
VHAVLDRPSAPTAGPLTYVGWLAAGRKVRHGEHGHRPTARADGTPRAHVFNLDQTDIPPTRYTDSIDPTRKAHPMTTPPTTTGPLTLATCSYLEFTHDMGTPIRFTFGYPRFLKLAYKIAGHAKLITPTRAILDIGAQDAYALAYRRHLNDQGTAAIRDELTRLVPGGGQVVLLCFERLNEVDKKTHAPKWCHRTIFGEWWTEQTGDNVPELGNHTHTTPTPTEPAEEPLTLF